MRSWVFITHDYASGRVGRGSLAVLSSFSSLAAAPASPSLKAVLRLFVAAEELFHLLHHVRGADPHLQRERRHLRVGSGDCVFARKCNPLPPSIFVKVCPFHMAALRISRKLPFARITSRAPPFCPS